MHLHYMEGKETNFNNYQKLIEVKFIFKLGLISLLVEVESTTRRKCMPKVISDSTKNVNLAPDLSWNYCWM